MINTLFNTFNQIMIIMRRAKILELPVQVLCTIFLIITTLSPVRSQDKETVRLLEFRYGFHLPAGDFADRFGPSSNLGAQVMTVSYNNNLFAGIDGMFLFGGEVREDVLARLRSFDGVIITNNGAAADVSLKERGYYIGLNAGKVFKTTENANNLTGFRVQIGGGFMQHKIRVQDNFQNVEALAGDYLKGYDRLTNGPAAHIALGYHYQSPRNNLHFALMTDFYGGFTKSRREFDFAELAYLDKARFDVLAGVTLAYIVTISRSTTSSEIYY